MRTHPLRARYPFFAATGKAVESADVAIATLVAEDTPAVERGVERVERALMEDTIEPGPGEAYPRETKTELFSYPISRIIASLVETPATVDRYAHAEANTSYECMLADFDASDNDVRGEAYASLDNFLREFDLDGAVRAGSDRNRNSQRTPDSYWIDVGPYLTYSDTDWGADWRLVNHSLADSAVRVTRERLSELFREAVRRRVTEGLPFAVHSSGAGDRFTDTLKPHVERLRNLLLDRGAVNVVYVNAANPDHSPSYVEALLARARKGEPLPGEAAFALVTFLVSVGLNPDEVRGVVGDETAEALQERATVLVDSGESQYAPPTCETMQAYGLCVSRDDHCDTIRHLMNYFETATNDADADAAGEAAD